MTAQRQWEALLAQSCGSLTLARSLVEACEEDFAERVREVESAWDRQDAVALAQAAHTAKSVVAVFSQGALLDGLASLESCARQGRLVDAQPLRAHWDGWVQDFHAEIRALKACMPSGNPSGLGGL